jgi:peroxiredoxin Q/BCP
MIMMVSIGEIAPDFALPNAEGRMVRLSNYKGKIIVLYFYPRALTSGCTREAVRFNNLLDKFHELGAVVIGVSADPVERIRKFKEKYGLRFQLLSDEKGDVIRLYDVAKKAKRISAKRITFIIDNDFRIYEILKNIRPAEKHADLALEIVEKLAEE